MSKVVKYSVVEFSWTDRRVVFQDLDCTKAEEVCLDLNARRSPDDVGKMFGMVPKATTVVLCNPEEQLGKELAQDEDDGQICQIWTDGACKGNPGACGSGIVIRYRSRVTEDSEFTGHGTNNESEYRALIAALKRAKGLGAMHIVVRSDSQLMIHQLLGQYVVKAPTIIPLHTKAQELLKLFKTNLLLHIPREENSRADKLASDAAARGSARPL